LPTISTSALQFQDYQFQVALAAGTWKWVTRVDVSKSSPSYQVRDILSPYGVLRDSIPLPGEVIQAMAASIVQIQTSFAPGILLSPTTLSFTVDEGRGFSPSQSVSVTNNGIFGSLLNVAVTSSAAFVTATPANLGGLASNVTGQFQVTVDSTDLVATSSPYAVVITTADLTAGNSPQTVAVTVTVRPKATIAFTPTPGGLSFSVTKPISGPFPVVPSQQFQVQNTGLMASSLSYQIQKLTNNSPWLTSFTPVFGTLAGGSAQNILVAVVPPATMTTGVYTETLRVSGYSSNFYVDVPVTLTIS
jgi:hypothetical protein